jgi:hypothetical protein
MRAAVLIVVLFLTTGAGVLFAADTVVGSVVSLHGSVDIDMFGKGAFIPAVSGDRLYAATVLRTGPGAGATLDLQGASVQVPPGATYRIADALEGARRAKRFAWLPSVIEVLKEAAASFGSAGSDVMLGDKATESLHNDTEWLEAPDDPAQLLHEAREKVNDGDFIGALADLDAIGEAGDDELPPGETAFLRGSACFGMGDYGSAQSHLERAEPLIRGSGDPQAAEILPVLLFQLGASRFFRGEDGPAAAALASCVALDVATTYDHFAWQLLLQALVNGGERAKAQEVLARARTRFAGSRYEAEFKTLPPGP